MKTLAALLRLCQADKVTEMETELQENHIIIESADGKELVGHLVHPMTNAGRLCTVYFVVLCPV